jgi:CheY-like chemotaxis protein
MSPEVLAHLFEPFYTTKPPGKGTGLGLAMVHGIVTQNGGQVRVESQPGQGTCFEILLPRTSQALPPAPLLPSTSTRGTETILVIEDDPQVRGVTVRALEGAGYRVLVAAEGAEALALARGRTEPLDLLVTDVVMPGLSGGAVAAELRRRDPSLRVLFVSGYARDALAQGEVSEAAAQFLPKPFTPSTLLERVRRILDGRSAGDPAA